MGNVKFVSKQRIVQSGLDRIGECPYCKAAMSMRSFPLSVCVVCGNTCNWEEDHIKEGDTMEGD